MERELVQCTAVELENLVPICSVAKFPCLGPQLPRQQGGHGGRSLPGGRSGGVTLRLLGACALVGCGPWDASTNERYADILIINQYPKDN